jgi:hypothetical protein
MANPRNLPVIADTPLDEGFRKTIYVSSVVGRSEARVIS